MIGLNQCGRVQRLCVARARPTTSNIDSHNRWFVWQDNAGSTTYCGVLSIADADANNIGDEISGALLYHVGQPNFHTLTRKDLSCAP